MIVDIPDHLVEPLIRALEAAKKGAPPTIQLYLYIRYDDGPPVIRLIKAIRHVTSLDLMGSKGIMDKSPLKEVLGNPGIWKWAVPTTLNFKIEELKEYFGDMVKVTNVDGQIPVWEVPS